jgi:serine/threonine protein phosphatase PrpC
MERHEKKTLSKQEKRSFIKRINSRMVKRKFSINVCNADLFLTKIMSNTLNRTSNSTTEENKTPISLEIFKKEYNKFQPGECSQKPFGVIKSYAYNTYHGLIKEVNEDKYLIVPHIKKPTNANVRTWPKMSLFGIFDGHGGEGCANYLKDNFLTCLLEDKNFPVDIKMSLQGTLERLETDFHKKFNSDEKNPQDVSGSCALITLIVDNKIYLANIGDSRAILSLENGTKYRPITIDHKPNNPKEYERIIKAGGKVYIDNDDPIRDINKVIIINNEKEFDAHIKDPEVVYRIYPCDLAVSRTIGDIKAKSKELNAIPGCISNNCEIFVFDNNNSNDFIIMGCDGIYDCLSNKDLVDTAWFAVNKLGKEKKYDINKVSLDMCNMIIKNSMDKLSADNLTVIIIGLDGLEKYLHNKINKEKIGNMIKENSKE